MSLSLEDKIEDKIGQMLGVGFDGTEAPDYVLEWLRVGQVGTVILFARNVETPDQVARLTKTLHAAAKYPLLICIDQEGGSVARLRQGFTESPGAMALGAVGSEQNAADVSRVLGEEMRALGINWTLAPVVDVTHSIDNPSVGTRSLGTNPAEVARLAAAEVRGFQAAGIAATAKHFPGIGNTPVDTHLAMAVIEGPLDFLWNIDLVPFRAAVYAGIETVMIGHVTFQTLDPDHPATLSRQVIQGLLRDEIGFKGVTCTDCMEMKAVADHFGAGESAVLAALAGEDIILFSHTQEVQQAAYDSLLEAAKSGRLSMERIDEAVGRVIALKQRVAITGKPDTAAIRSESHLKVMRAAARSAITLVREDRDVFPLPQPTPEGTVLIEFTSYMESQAMDNSGLSDLAAMLHEALPTIQTLEVPPDEIPDEAAHKALVAAKDAELLIVATRNAHLLPEQEALAGLLLALGKPAVLLCLRNPYDAAVLSGADAAICTCGDSQPALEAAVAALMGEFTPSGKLPVVLPTEPQV